MAKEADEEVEPEEGEEPKPKKERPDFDLIEFKTEFDANNPTIEIPAEVVDDIDNDYDLPYSAPSFEKEWKNYISQAVRFETVLGDTSLQKLKL